MGARAVWLSMRATQRAARLASSQMDGLTTWLPMLEVVVWTTAELRHNITLVPRYCVGLAVDDQAVPFTDTMPDVLGQPNQFAEAQVFKHVNIVLAEDIRDAELQ